MNDIDAAKVYELETKIALLEQENQRLKKTEEQFRLAIEASQDGLWDWNLIDNTIYFSPQWKLMIGYEDSELPNELSTWENLVHPDDISQAYEAIQASLENPSVRYANIHRLRHKNGTYIWNYDHGKVIFNAAGEPIRMIGFHTDITHERQMREEIERTQEMMIVQSRHAAMGEMIGMIAHQWRQPLSIVSMMINNILIDIELGELEPDQCRVCGDGILEQMNYLSKTIDVFRDFFRPDEKKEKADVVTLIRESESMIDASLKNNQIDLEIDIDDVVEPVYVRSRELLQVLINILKNAKEAIVINNTVDAKIRITLRVDRTYAIIEICNNGPSIGNDVLPKIFDPYFSTKDEKTGTGLGLYMSKIVVEKHLGGEIGAYNSADGVCFTIQIPYIVS